MLSCGFVFFFALNGAREAKSQNLICLIFVLSGCGEIERMGLDKKQKEYRKYLSSKETESIEQVTNKHNAILIHQSHDLEYMSKKGWINGFRFLELNKMLVNFCDQMGMSERIKNTIFPTTYTYYTRIFIWFLIISVTFVTIDLGGFWLVDFIGFLLILFEFH